MDNIQIVFGVKIIGIGGYILQFPEISFLDTTPAYKNIKLVPVDSSHGLYEIYVDKNVSNEYGNELKTVIQEATSEAQSFVYVFSLSANIKIFEFICKGYRKNDLLIKLDQIFCGFNTGIEFASATFSLSFASDDDRIEQIKKGMKEDYDLSQLQMFFDSATVNEPVGRFIGLYTFMLHHCSDKQEEVDRAILSIDSTVAQSKNPRGKYETLYTKIRNELSHKRGTNIIETHNHARANVDRFEYIVRKYIFDK
jgi:hypothetical protein